MADNNRDTHVTRETHIERDRGGSGRGMAFVLGAVVIGLVVVAWFVFSGTADSVDPGTTNVTVEAPDASGAVEDAANAVEGAADSAGDAAESAGDAAESTADSAN